MADNNEQELGDHVETEGNVGHQGASSSESISKEGENLDEVYAQLAQKDRDLVLAAELGKALLESNQDLQSRYDQLLEEFNFKVESLQQEKYNLHLDFEKLETEHQNRVKDLQDDISVLREQLLENSHYKHTTEAETSQYLQEANQKSEYLADQVQQAGRKHEELLDELEAEKEKNKSNQLVIDDHLEHIAMLREQVEYLSEKLKESAQALKETQEENELLLRREKTLMDQLQSLETTEQQGLEVPQNDDNQFTVSDHPQSTSISSHAHSGKAAAHKKQPEPPIMEGFYSYQNISFSEFHPMSLFKPVGIPCRTGELAASNRTSPVSSSESVSAVQQKSPIPNNSVLAEFSTPFRHKRNKSDCSISSMTEGSRKRHYETIALSSDEDESHDRNVKTAHCKQSMLSKLIDSSGAQKFPSKSHHRRVKNGGAGDPEGSFTSGSPTSGSILEDSKESGFSLAVTVSGEESSSTITTTHALDIPDAGHPHLPSHDTLPRPHEVSLFDELSSHSIKFNRQDSRNSEKSLFDELSDHVHGENDEENSDFSSSCLLGRPDFYSHSGWLCDRGDAKPGSQQADSKQSDSESNYTNEWPLLSSVSVDMLEDDDDDDDFECDDDDFLVGNNAGSTLSIGDSGVGPTLKSYHSSLDAEPLDTSDPWTDSDGNRWSGKLKEKNKQALEEACKQLRQLVARLGGRKWDAVRSGLVSPVESYQDSEFDQLLSLIQELRMCVDQMDHHEIPHLKSRQYFEDENFTEERQQRSAFHMDVKDLRRNMLSTMFVRRSL